MTEKPWPNSTGPSIALTMRAPKLMRPGDSLDNKPSRWNTPIAPRADADKTQRIMGGSAKFIPR